MATAVLFDGGFYLKRYRYLRGYASPETVARDLHWMARQHLKQENGRDIRTLYRIFFYDCPPLSHKAHNPVTGKAIDFAKTDTAKWRLAFHNELRKLRKVALRLGYLNERTAKWKLEGKRLNGLLQGKVSLEQITEDDVRYDSVQKGVDMRIGLDIASMVFKAQVDQIILVSGDSDFVPAAKLARREGVDFMLDPMWAKLRDDLHEHIDGLRSIFARKVKPETSADEESQSAKP